MRIFWCSALLTFLFFNCNKRHADKVNLLSRIPEDCNIIFKLSNLESLKSAINQNDLFQELSSLDTVYNINEQIPLKYFQTNTPIYIGINDALTDDMQISLVTEQLNNVLNYDSIPNLVVEIITRNNQDIEKIQIDSNLYYSTIKDSIFFLSNKLSLTQDFLKSKNDGGKAIELFDKVDHDKNFSIFTSKDLSHIIELKDSTAKNLGFTNFTMLDLELDGNDVYLSGITEANQKDRIINSFSGSIPQENRMAQICPVATSSFTSYTSQDMNLINSKIRKLIEADSTNYKAIFHNIVEFGHAKIGNSRVSILRSLDVDMTLEELEAQETNTTFRNVDIFKFYSSETVNFKNLTLLDGTNPEFFINLEDFLIFSKEEQILKTIISNYQNGNTISNTPAYENLMQNLSDEASIFVYKSPQTLNSYLQKVFNINTPINTKAYSTSALQIIYDTDFAHVNAAIKTFDKRNDIQVKESLNLNIDYEVHISQYVKNHTNNEMDLLVQDINNRLYLISNQGKVFWKKQINGKILGRVQQIDMYKNGRLQLVFATENRIYVLDRNGNDAAPFPLKFSDKITQPLSVFDYENNRNYRLLVSQGKDLIMFNQLGNRISGFNYSGAEQSIRTQPKHIRIGGKDYITFSQGNQMEILSRVGKTRVEIDNKFQLSHNDIYRYNNKFITTITSGDLVEVQTNGKVKIKNLQLKENHKISATERTLVTLSENKLTIRSKTVELDYGNYTEPQIFYLNNKIYVSVTDLQTRKVYLFDSQAEIIAGFPVYGNSSIDMEDIDKDNKIEILTKGEKNTLMIYEIN